jgi:hypothetical protein
MKSCLSLELPGHPQLARRLIDGGKPEWYLLPSVHSGLSCFSDIAARSSNAVSDIAAPILVNVLFEVVAIKRLWSSR